MKKPDFQGLSKYFQLTINYCKATLYLMMIWKKAQSQWPTLRADNLYGKPFKQLVKSELSKNTRQWKWLMLVLTAPDNTATFLLSLRPLSKLLSKLGIPFQIFFIKSLPPSNNCWPKCFWNTPFMNMWKQWVWRHQMDYFPWHLISKLRW